MLTDESRENLVRIAAEARSWAYAPYSNYSVGASVLTQSGRIYDGVNVENAAYPVTMCAERVALFKAISQGETQFQALAVVTSNGGAPCGSCRQVLAEFGLDTIILVAQEDGNVLYETTVRDLLPDSFGPAKLNK